MCMLVGGGGGGGARTCNVLLFVVITLHPNSLVIFIRSVKKICACIDRCCPRQERMRCLDGGRPRFAC